MRALLLYAMPLWTMLMCDFTINDIFKYATKACILHCEWINIIKSWQRCKELVDLSTTEALEKSNMMEY